MGETVKDAKKNWKTTACGVLMLIAIACGAIGVPIIDGDPETNVNWAYVTENAQAALVLLGIAVPSFLGMFLAKDGDK